jgi:hypothetical protein
MSHDLLLEWISERGEGSWTQLRHAHDWLFAGRHRPAFQTPAFTVGLLSTLGHLEMDWIAQRWAGAPPVITLLPSAGAHALLTGARTRTLMQRLEQELADDHHLYPLPPLEQRLAPSAVLIPCEEAEHIEALAARLEIPYQHSVSERLSELLPTLDGYLELARSAPPPRGYGFQALDPFTLGWRDQDDEDSPGLYRYEGYGGFIYQLRDQGGASYRVDMPLGVYAELRRLGDSRLKWFRHSVNGQLTVPLTAPLPALHARAAALCSGLAPMRRGKTLVYVNVPEHVASRVARSLGQTLQIVDA